MATSGGGLPFFRPVSIPVLVLLILSTHHHADCDIRYRGTRNVGRKVVDPLMCGR